MIPPDVLRCTSDVSQKRLSTRLCGEYAPGLLVTEAASFCTEQIESDRKSGRIRPVFQIKHVPAADHVSFLKKQKTFIIACSSAVEAQSQGEIIRSDGDSWCHHTDFWSSELLLTGKPERENMVLTHITRLIVHAMDVAIKRSVS